MKPFTLFGGRVIGGEVYPMIPSRPSNPEEPEEPEEDVITGTIFPYAGTSVPDGYLECDGTAVSRSTYAALFAVIGTTWGAGNGTTTFNLPDFTGRSILGAGSGSGLTFRSVAEKGGTETHTLQESEMPAHTHAPLTGGTSFNVGWYMGGHEGDVGGSGATWDATTGSTGGGQAHNNMMPFTATKILIKT